MRLSGYLICATVEEAALVRQHLPQHIRLSRAEPDCLWFEVVPTENPMVWRVEEEYSTQAGFEAHQARVKASAWGSATLGIKRDYSITDQP